MASVDSPQIRSLVTAGKEEESNPIIGTRIRHTATTAKYHDPNFRDIFGIASIPTPPQTWPITLTLHPYTKPKTLTIRQSDEDFPKSLFFPLVLLENHSS